MALAFIASMLQPEFEGQVPLGSTDLAAMAAEYRFKTSANPLANISTFEYTTEAGPAYVTARNIPSPAKGVAGVHAEDLIKSYLKGIGVDPKSVTRIYSERIPCVDCTGDVLKSFPNALVTYSLHGGDGRASVSAIVKFMQENGR
jgi:hypothetical protein